MGIILNNHEFTNEDIQYVVDNASKNKTEHFLEKFNVTRCSFRKKIWVWNKNGWNIPRIGSMEAAEGEVAWRVDGGKIRCFIKKNKKWVRVVGAASRPLNGEKGISKLLSDTPLTKKPGIPLAKSRSERKKVFKTRKTDTSTSTAVYIPHLRMTVYVKPGRNVDDVIASYSKPKSYK